MTLYILTQVLGQSVGTLVGSKAIIEKFKERKSVLEKIE